MSEQRIEDKVYKKKTNCAEHVEVSSAEKCNLDDVLYKVQVNVAEIVKIAIASGLLST